MRTRPAIVACFLVITAVACSSGDGRELPEPRGAQVTAPASGPEVGQPSDEADPGVFTLSSPSFLDRGEIPAQHTCGGNNVSPTLIWTGTPAGAELAIVVRDLDADGFIHWVVSGIDPVIEGIGEGGIPEGAIAGANSTGTAGWFGPCPPPGSGVHNYEFVIHVLPSAVAMDPSLSADQAAERIENASVARASLFGNGAAID